MTSVSWAATGAAATNRVASESSAARRANRMRVTSVRERLGVDRRAPPRGGGRARAGGVEGRRAPLGGGRGDGAVAEGVAGDGENRRDLGGGAGEERLVGDVELGAVDLALRDV